MNIKMGQITESGTKVPKTDRYESVNRGTGPQMLKHKCLP